jgi:hypothetical protein
MNAQIEIIVAAQFVSALFERRARADVMLMRLLSGRSKSDPRKINAVV